MSRFNETNTYPITSGVCVCVYTGTQVANIFHTEYKRLHVPKEHGVRHIDSELLLNKAAPGSGGEAGRALLWGITFSF